MKWNWQLSDWPNFQFVSDELTELEGSFLRHGGQLIGAFKHLLPTEEEEVTAEVLISEAVTTSGIEGEILDRQSVRASILRQMGIHSGTRRIGPRELGISRMTTDLLHTATEKLSHAALFSWHRMLMQGRDDVAEVGAYRTDPEPMEIISGPIGSPTIHFVAPPSHMVTAEMSRFIEWFNKSKATLPALTRSGIAHLYFESIHPFEDGNGRIGRAISEKALAQALGQPSLTMLSTEIESRRTEYYAALESATTSNEATEWLVWFGKAVLAGQARTQTWIDFLIAKTKLLDKLRGKINERQEKAIHRAAREGPEGFKGGLSAGNYQRITGASPATAGRDLTEMVNLGVLRKTGVGKGTRYWLDLP